MLHQNLLRVYVDADVIFRAVTPSHKYTAAVVLLRMAEFTLLEVVTAQYTVEEAIRSLDKYIPTKRASLLQLIGQCMRVVDDPSVELVRDLGHQAHYKDVVNLAAAVHAAAHVLVTYNLRDYFPQPGVIQVMTPGALVAAARTAIFQKFTSS